MTSTRIAAGLACLALATCCPTLWLQMTKTDPAPWPEVPTPNANAPVIPVAMPNRFDVLEGGALTRFADGYRDVVDARGDERAQQSRAVMDLDAILKKYGDERLISCAPDKSVTATVSCTAPGHCNAIEVADAPQSPAMVLVGGQPRVVVGAGRDPESKRWTVGLAVPINASDGQQLPACFFATVPLSRPLMSFVHMSDIQLRDPSVVLTDRKLSKRLDWFEPLNSFEYDEDLAFYNQYLFESVVATINAAAGPSPGRDPERPRFVIHTGDSVDANAMSELRRFHTVIDRLRIPFFELFGNHDVLVFGNLTPTDQTEQANDKKCAPVATLLGRETSVAPNKICVDVHVKPCASCTARDVELIASTEGHAATRKRFIDELQHSPEDPVAEPAVLAPGAYCADTKPRVMNAAYSRAHGFDLGTSDDTLTGPRLGYYAFVEPLPDQRRAVFIALNGEEITDYQGGIGGRIGREQLAWLQRVLDCGKQPAHAHDLVFVLAHQPLGLLTVESATGQPELSVEETLRGSPNVVGFLYGHHHNNAICADRRVDAKGKLRTCTKFWEIETASLVEFPQEARMVRIKQLGKQLAFLEVSTFGEQLAEPDSQMARYVSLARRGAERDHCVTHEARCSEDKRPYRTDGNSTAARLFFKLP